MIIIIKDNKSYIKIDLKILYVKKIYICSSKWDIWRGNVQVLKFCWLLPWLVGPILAGKIDATFESLDKLFAKYRRKTVSATIDGTTK